MTSAEFEGPEKKLKVTLTSGAPSLRAFSEATWREVLAAAGAGVVSRVRGERWDAYVLSESSLFVGDASMTLITCGQTHLVGAAERLLEELAPGALSQLIYERKSEHFPHLQATSFEEDAARLSALLASVSAAPNPAHTLRIGEGREFYVDVLHHRAAESSEQPTDASLEVLMHRPSEAICARFDRARAPDAQALIRTIAPGFELHEHYFEPQGYSVNGLLGEAFVTVHVTPEVSGSYVSFELQGPAESLHRGRLRATLEALAATFEPASLEALLFLPSLPSHPREVRPLEKLPTELPRYDVCAEGRAEVAGYELTFAALEPKR